MGRSSLLDNGMPLHLNVYLIQPNSNTHFIPMSKIKKIEEKRSIASILTNIMYMATSHENSNKEE